MEMTEVFCNVAAKSNGIVHCIVQLAYHFEKINVNAKRNQTPPATC